LVSPLTISLSPGLRASKTNAASSRPFAHSLTAKLLAFLVDSRHSPCGSRHLHYSNVLTDCQPAGMPVSLSLFFYDQREKITRFATGLAASSTFREEILTLERTITRFASTLVQPHQLITMIEDRHTLLVIHSLIHAAMIHLYYRLGNDDPASYDKALRAARSCIGIIKHIADTDFDFLDPIIGVGTHSCYILSSSWVLIFAFA
jgi:hypothetical protein